MDNNILPSKIKFSRQDLIAIFIGIYFFLKFIPPNYIDFQFRWYIDLIFASFLFIFFKKNMNFRAAKEYMIMAGIIWIGAFIGLTRSPNFNVALYELAGFGITIFVSLLFIPSFSLSKSRKAIVISLLLCAILWSIEIFNQWSMLGESVRNFWVGKGQDRNAISLALAFGNVILVSALILKKQKKNFINFVITILLLIGIFLFLYATFRTYSRSGFITNIISLLIVMFLLNKTKKNFFIFAVISIIFLFYGSQLFEFINQNSPIWLIKFQEIFRFTDQNTSLYVRYSLLRKSLLLIMENPIIGIGLNNFRYMDLSSIAKMGSLAHNSYLASWVEVGIFGLLSYFYMIFLWIKIAKNSNEMNFFNRIIIYIFIPLFIMMFFLDISSLINTFRIILSGYILNKSKA